MVLSSESVAAEVSDVSELESSSPSNCRFSRFLGVEGSAVGSSTEMNQEGVILKKIFGYGISNPFRYIIESFSIIRAFQIFGKHRIDNQIKIIWF